MAQTVQGWLNGKEVKRLKSVPLHDLVTKEFFRDPLRPTHYNRQLMYAPADGVVLYAHADIGPDERIIEVKGRDFTVRDLLNDPAYDERSLVVGIFMSLYDVHVNRMPTDGVITEVEETPSMFTHNTSMYALEQGLFAGERVDRGDLAYLFENERLISRVYAPGLRSDYYMVQIADRDINSIVNWGEDDSMMQGDRFGMIRWGSQVDLVVPLAGKRGEFKLEMLAKRFTHVEAGVDAIVRIK